MEFDNCIINEPDNQPTIVRGSGISIANITGNITFNGPYGLQSNLGTGTNVTLSVATNSPTKPPIVTSVIPAKGSPAHVTDFTAGDVINISAVAYDPDIATANGAGISRVDFALWRGDGVVASISDVSAPYDWSLVTTTQYERGIYLIRITAYSQDGSYTVAVVPVNLFEPTLITGRVDLKTESNKKLNVKTFPNPFIERVTFEYSLPDTGETNLKIYDISGIKVKIYDFGLQSKGLNNKNVDLKGLADGIYYYRLTCGKAVQNGKIIKV
ncbi:MAG: T9SS type A sorting domain-containing protein [Prolixibacteraceae bacterium]|nr:T9SS type A sorting domain-containing protein [Prolixibacteraceae bacterium]